MLSTSESFPSLSPAPSSVICSDDICITSSMHSTGRLTLCRHPSRREATERFLKKTCESQRAHIITNEQPSVWFETDEVWEVKGADLTISPVHMCGCNIMDGKGLALRFPRFLRIRFA
jgi:hypothetical protein